MSMHRKTNVQKNTESGFALLMAIVVVGVLISIGLSVLELTIAQVRLSSNARDSETSFHAANAGVECALYTRRQNANAMETGGNITPSCFNGSLDSNTRVQLTGGDVSGDGEAYLYNYEFTWGLNNDRCSQVTTLVASSTPNGADLDVNNMTTHVPGYVNGNTLTCVAGARCTVISVRGYNKTCANASTFGTVQREVLLQL